MLLIKGGMPWLDAAVSNTVLFLLVICTSYAINYIPE